MGKRKIMSKIRRADRERDILAAESLVTAVNALRELGGGYEIPRAADGEGTPLPADECAPLTLVWKALNQVLRRLADQDHARFLVIKNHIMFGRESVQDALRLERMGCVHKMY